MYLIEGLEGNRLALYIKSHQALVNGMSAVEIGHVICDRSRRPATPVEDIWLPRGEPSDGQLMIDAVGDWLARPGHELPALRSTVADVVTNSGELAELVRRAEAWCATWPGATPRAVRSTPPSRGTVRFTVASGPLADYRLVHSRYDCDVNDVVLSVIAGALRNWLLSRGEPVPATLKIRAMAPTSGLPGCRPGVHRSRTGDQ